MDAGGVLITTNKVFAALLSPARRLGGTRFMAMLPPADIVKRKKEQFSKIATLPKCLVGILTKMTWSSAFCYPRSVVCCPYQVKMWKLYEITGFVRKNPPFLQGPIIS